MWYFEDATNVVNFIQPGTYTIEKMGFTKYLSFISMTPVENVTLVDVKYTLDSKATRTQWHLSAMSLQGTR